ncbi:MAG: hypothetical protein QHH05_06480 [Syntrophomonadaceae bacterium]|jgi:hypothetical protein|nr:hypothetical protein [Syntrophomonadaceae bacterium]MDH7498075.1 hypothetical protein [Syntrophomonadaceae bacterium]
MGTVLRKQRCWMSLLFAMALTLAVCGAALANGPGGGQAADIEGNNLVIDNCASLVAVDNELDNVGNKSIIAGNTQNSVDASFEDNDRKDIDVTEQVNVDKSVSLQDICVWMDCSRTKTITTTLDNSHNQGVIIQDSSGVAITQVSDISLDLNILLANSFNEDSYNVRWENVGNTNYKNVGNEYYNNVGNTYDICLTDVGNEYKGSFNQDWSASSEVVNVKSFNDKAVTIDNAGNDYSQDSFSSTSETVICNSVNYNEVALGLFNLVD